jgi:hypothetical protein
VPDAVEIGGRRFIQHDAARGQQPVQDAPVQPVDVRPRQRTAAHLLHRRRVAGAPGECKFTTVHRQAQACHFGGDAAVPVDDGAEDVEAQRADAGQHRRGPG